MKQLIKDIKKLTNFFQFLQDFDPKDYEIDTCTEYGTVKSEDNNKESYIL